MHAQAVTTRPYFKGLQNEATCMVTYTVYTCSYIIKLLFLCVCICRQPYTSSFLGRMLNLLCVLYVKLTSFLVLPMIVLVIPLLCPIF